MSSETQVVKEKLKLAITQLCSTSWMFVKNPARDFTRERKLPLHEVISILLCMEGGSLTGELLRYFRCRCHSPSGSAFIQQRQKINEFAFRELKYTVGLLHFHAKKVENITQAIFARLIMYNFSELITSHVVIQKPNRKYPYKANFSVAVQVCKQFLLGNISPPDVEATISKNVSVTRTGRSNPRNMVVKHAVSFLYRVA